MAAPNETILHGYSITEGEFYPTNAQPRLYFCDQKTKKTFSIDEPSVFQNLLLLGGSGSGKTNIMNQIVAQVLKWNRTGARDGVSLIFDTKGDYISYQTQNVSFYQPDDYIIGNDRRYRSRSVVWNIFDEVLADGDDPADYEANAREMANVLFKDRGSTTQPFFANAARDIFAHMLIYFIRKSKSDPAGWADKRNNYDFVATLQHITTDKLIQCFREYSDMHGLISYIGDGTSNQALGVFGELRTMLNDCFQGIFCQRGTPSRTFSIRKAIRQKGGHTIFILYDMSLGETLVPIYRLLVDLALKEALSTHANGHTHIFLDELKLLPKITHLEDALNFGRSKRVSVVAGLQSVGQIYSIYGEEAGQVILGGFGSVIALKTADYKSRDYISQLFGPNLTAYRYYNGSNSPIDRERDGHAVEHWHIQKLGPGQGIVGLVSQPEPFFFFFEKAPV